MIIAWLCDILALVWHFGPACVTFRPGLCDILALSCVTKASACHHHTPIITTGAVYRKFHRSSVPKTTKQLSSVPTIYAWRNYPTHITKFCHLHIWNLITSLESGTQLRKHPKDYASHWTLFNRHQFNGIVWECSLAVEPSSSNSPDVDT